MKVPLRVVDVETTDMAPPVGELLEIGWTDMVFDTETKESTIGAPQHRMYDVEHGIPFQTQAVHHIQPHHVAGLPLCTPEDIRFVAVSELGLGVPQFLVAHQASFEQQWFTPDLCGEARWIDTFKCALRIYPDAPAHNNQTLKYMLGFGGLSEDLCMPPHRAAPDSYVTAHIVAKMLETELARDLVGWTLAPRYIPFCPIGVHRGKPWSDVPHDFLAWMTRLPDMDADLKAAAAGEIQFRKNTRT